jgi:uncharacterized protein (TIGR03083 family)
MVADVYAPRIVAFAVSPDDPTLESFAELDLPPRFEAWVESDRTILSMLPDGLIELFEATSAKLEAALRAAPPDQRVKDWWTPQQTAGFLQRRLALETAIHRWDAQCATGTPDSIESTLAADGIDEVLDIQITDRRQWAPHRLQGSGETYHLHRTDGEGEWLIRFAPEGPIVTREHAKGDIALRGTASDLFLFLWHRIPADQLEIFGDASLAERFFELVPPD